MNETTNNALIINYQQLKKTRMNAAYFENMELIFNFFAFSEGDLFIGNTISIWNIPLLITQDSIITQFFLKLPYCLQIVFKNEAITKEKCL